MQPKVLANVSEECDCNEKDDNVLAKEKKITLELSEIFHHIERAKIRFWRPISSMTRHKRLYWGDCFPEEDKRSLLFSYWPRANIKNYLWMTLRAHFGEGDGTPLQYSCLENPMDRGAWWAAVYGVTQSRHDWSSLAAAAARAHLMQ